ncbi:hypothetical protein M011DRAFT_399428 [Sporormia fimetaria CBS 119925]|uniref:Uncharacterized protein n=1 Tax=Sporormia fimetaria CBS 119925 TaxID=1340428 RepID=A0A6A6VHH2_9PLEO|nr:hypothetical protein M011DRAFT_399428 [Sporormia fimetaria CBS 119925]
MAGVAFELTPDYGVAAIHNGLDQEPSVPIARIQGSLSYQAFMRKRTTSNNRRESMLCRLLAPALERLPPEFGLDFCRSPDVVATKTMLANLKQLVESYLGTNICFAAISLDDPEGEKPSVVEEALEALGLRQVLPTLPRARTVVSSHTPQHSPDLEEEAWNILAIESSSRWSSIGLYSLNEGINDAIEGFVSGPIFGDQNQLTTLGDALRHLFENPPANITHPEKIHHLVLYGDNMTRDALSLLNTILGADLVANAVIAKSMFDGVGLIANTVHGQLSWVNARKPEPAFGCKWRSEFWQWRSNFWQGQLKLAPKTRDEL